MEPTVIVADAPDSFSLQKELFGPLLAVHVYDDADWDDILEVVDRTSQYALTCSVFGTDRGAVTTPWTCCETPQA